MNRRQIILGLVALGAAPLLAKIAPKTLYKYWLPKGSSIYASGGALCTEWANGMTMDIACADGLFIPPGIRAIDLELSTAKTIMLVSSGGGEFMKVVRILR